MNIKKIATLFIALLFLTLSFGSCKPKPTTQGKEPQTQSKTYYEYFNTVSAVFSYQGDAPEVFAENCAEVEKLLKEYHQLFDIYYEYAGVNNIKTINQNAGKSPVAVDAKLIDFLLYCKDAYTLTKGETNIAMGSVLKLWHDAREAAAYHPQAPRIPSTAELAEAAKHTNIDDLIIDKEAGTVYLADPQMSLDVGAIGKGYATEQAAQLLISRGVTSYVLNLGGNIRAIGEKVTGNGWTTGITNPDKNSVESFICKVIIKDISLVTSGDYERYYYVNGEKYHHIIDKDTNMPSTHFSSVSVFTPNSALADTLSTALFCMSYEEGLDLIRSIGGIDVIWVMPNGTVKMTDGITVVSD